MEILSLHIVLCQSIRLITLYTEARSDSVLVHTPTITDGLSGCEQANGHSTAKHSVSKRSLSSEPTSGSDKSINN